MDTHLNEKALAFIQDLYKRIDEYERSLQEAKEQAEALYPVGCIVRFRYTNSMGEDVITYGTVKEVNVWSDFWLSWLVDTLEFGVIGVCVEDVLEVLPNHYKGL